MALVQNLRTRNVLFKHILSSGLCCTKAMGPPITTVHYAGIV
jgi:hypothetical protein